MILNPMIFADTEKGKKMRLIDADAFLEEARNKKDMQYIHLPIHMIALVIDEMPTVDAEPVVRCKDCIYNKGEVNRKGFQICSANGMDITDHDYCSWGERMDKGEEE